MGLVWFWFLKSHRRGHPARLGVVVLKPQQGWPQCLCQGLRGGLRFGLHPMAPTSPWPSLLCPCDPFSPYFPPRFLTVPVSARGL